MSKPKIDEFSLNKVQKVKNGGLKIDYTALYPMGDTKIERKSNETFEIAPMDDFALAIKSLKRYVATVIHFGKLNTIIGDNKFKVTKEQSSYITSLYNTWMQKITINSVQLFSDGEMITHCKIGYSLEGYNGQMMDSSTYKIDLDESLHQWEVELRDKCNEIVKHAYDYIFNGVGTVIDMFTDEQKDGLEGQDEQEGEE